MRAGSLLAKTSPILVELKDKEDKIKMFRNIAELRNAEDKYKGLSIGNDLSPDERKEMQTLIKEADLSRSSSTFSSRISEIKIFRSEELH